MNEDGKKKKKFGFRYNNINMGSVIRKKSINNMNKEEEYELPCWSDVMQKKKWRRRTVKTGEDESRLE